jgi:poly(ADP-ribose) glycohydrolase ARH3
MNGPRNRLDAAAGALLGTFVGDALGMPFEGMPAEAMPTRIEMVEARLGRGTYTDDTQMMIALAESLIERDTVDDEHLARAFLDGYDPRRGYGGGTRRVLQQWTAGTPVGIAAGRIFGGQGSRGNGAAMRIAPIAVRFAEDPERLVVEAARSAAITHAHPVGVDAAVVQAAAIGAALRGVGIVPVALKAAHSEEMRSGLRDVAALLDAGLEAEEASRWLGSSSDACESVCAAVYAALAHSSFEQAVVFAVRLGGDADTVAAMTGAIVGSREGAGSIPARWLDALEDDERGRSHVEQLAARLTAAT